MDSIRCKSNIHENIERNTFMSKELQIRNSTVDFLVFTRDAGEDGIEVRVQNGDVWLTQKAISQLFDVDRSVVTKHLSNIFKEELDENSVCAKFAQTADDGKTYNYKFYSLAAIIAVGYRINSEQAIVQNKMHYVVHGNTAAEVIVARADHNKEHMELKIMGKCAGCH